MSALRASDLPWEEPGTPGTPGGEEPTVHLSRMRRRHLRHVLRIEALTSAPGWSLGLFMSELSRPDDRCYVVARLDGAVVGYGGMLFTVDGGHVTTLAVDPDHRRRQVATRVMLALVRDALSRDGVEALTLEVRAGNRGAQSLYRAFGFAPVGARKDYYRDPTEDAIVMWAHDVDTPEYAERLTRLEASIRGATLAEGLIW